MVNCETLFSEFSEKIMWISKCFKDGDSQNYILCVINKGMSNKHKKIYQILSDHIRKKRKEMRKISSFPEPKDNSFLARFKMIFPHLNS